MSFLIGAGIIAGTGALIAGGAAIGSNKNRKASERQANKLAGQQQTGCC
jgi:hypothetical protein